MAMNEQHMDMMEEPIFDMMLFDSIDDIIVDLPTDDDVLSSFVDVDVDVAPPPAPATTAAPTALAAAPEDQLGEKDIAELEWLSNFFDDSSDPKLDFPASAATAAIPTTVTPIDDYFSKDESFFRSFSPVSVLDPSNNVSGAGISPSSSSSSSSSSFSGGGSDNSLTTAAAAAPAAVPARARSKRPRPAAFCPRVHVTIPYLPPSSDPAGGAAAQPEVESFGESATPPPMMKRKKAKKSSSPLPGAGGDPAGGGEGPAVRKCMHCEITKTPQWRAGPMGPKTLCNACGVRYKSGRLFPEYRPAASPTFVPSVHSNSHKKVVEMRIKATTKRTDGPSPEKKSSCDLLDYIRRRE